MATGGAVGGPPGGLIYLNFPPNDPSELELSKEVEPQVNNFFVKLLRGQGTPEEMLKMVFDYATQPDPRGKKLLDGILRMLSNEVCRHLTDYPENVLKPITELYGDVLANLVSQ